MTHRCDEVAGGWASRRVSDQTGRELALDGDLFDQSEVLLNVGPDLGLRRLGHIAGVERPRGDRVERVRHFGSVPVFSSSE